MALRVVSVPVLAVLRVGPDGTKRLVLVALELGSPRRRPAWARLVGDLERRGLASPVLIVSGGHRGLANVASHGVDPTGFSRP